MFILHGGSPRKGLIGIIAYPHIDDPYVQYSFSYGISACKDWGRADFPGYDIRAITYARIDDKPSWWLVSKGGVVFDNSSRGRYPYEIPGVELYGNLNDIQNINNELYVCGGRRQVYKKTGNEWVRFDKGIRGHRGEDCCTFESIHGLSEDTLHAVGSKGEIWYHDGVKWSKANSPTNKWLNKVLMVAPGLCYVCGKDGTVLRGFRDSWEIVDSGIDDHFWGMALFKGKVYLTTDNNLYVIDGNNPNPVDLGRAIDAASLCANNEELYLIETYDVSVFDGTKWEMIPTCPDNT